MSLGFQRFNSVFNRNIQIKNKIMKWIKVEDELPLNGSDVIVIIPKKEGGYYVPFSCEYDGGFYDEEDLNLSFSSEVSHWMELPKPPKQ